MTGMQLSTADPRGHIQREPNPPSPYIALESPLFPFIDHHVHVIGQFILMALPHADRRMMGPPASSTECIKDDHGLKALIAQASVIEATRRFPKIGIWDKSLHLNSPYVLFREVITFLR